MPYNFGPNGNARANIDGQAACSERAQNKALQNRKLSQRTARCKLRRDYMGRAERLESAENLGTGPQR